MMSLKMDSNNILNRCRLCLKFVYDPSTFLHLLDLKKRVNKCLNIKICPFDGSPQKVCMTCSDSLNTYFEFRQLCRISDKKIKTYLKDINIIDKSHQPSIECIQEEINKGNTYTQKNNANGTLYQLDNNLKSLIHKENNLEAQKQKRYDNLPKPGGSKKGRKKGSESFQCESCGKIMKKKNQLIRHIRTHTGDCPFLCIICGKKFKLKHHLENHRWTHSSEKPFQCLECGKYFSEKGSLKKHFVMHTQEKEFECTHCTLKFKSVCNKRRHIKRHLDKKIFTCSQCQNVYLDSTSLNRHTFLHHPST